jgi:hypothetical protein
MPHGRRTATFAMALMARAPVEGGRVHLAAVFAQMCGIGWHGQCARALRR